MNRTPTLDDARVAQGFVRLRSRAQMAAFMGWKMPLGLAAGLRVDAIDLNSCVVSMPGGWRTQNPFGSTYWAAQGMAAEMATGLHAYVMSASAPSKVGMILAGCEGGFSKMCKGRSTYRFDQGGQVREAIESTLASGERVSCPVEVVGFDPVGDEISRWTFTWSFRAKR